jgi:ParB family chromosome partitioning protein
MTVALASPLALVPPRANAQGRILTDLPIELIRAAVNNPRRTFAAAGLEELQASIAELGIQEPLLVRMVAYADGRGVDFYEVVSGHRRLRAARALGLEKVPCLVARGMTDAEASETAIVANLQRVDIHPMEEAEAYGALIEAAEGWVKVGQVAVEGKALTAEDVAKRVGKSTVYVTQRLKLRDLISAARMLFVGGHLTLGHALLLAKLTPVDQDRAVRHLISIEHQPKKDSTDDSWVWFVVVLVLYPEILVETVADYLKGRA